MRLTCLVVPWQFPQSKRFKQFSSAVKLNMFIWVVIWEFLIEKTSILRTIPECNHTVFHSQFSYSYYSLISESATDYHLCNLFKKKQKTPIMVQWKRTDMREFMDKSAPLKPISFHRCIVSRFVWWSHLLPCFGNMCFHG